MCRLLCGKQNWMRGKGEYMRMSEGWIERSSLIDGKSNSTWQASGERGSWSTYAHRRQQEEAISRPEAGGQAGPSQLAVPATSLGGCGNAACRGSAAPSERGSRRPHSSSRSSSRTGVQATSGWARPGQGPGEALEARAALEA